MVYRTKSFFCWVFSCVLFLAVSSAVSQAGERGLLFRVQRGNEPPNYLFGTMHSDDPRVLAKAEGLKARIKNSRLLVLEMEPDVTALISTLASMYLADGRTLEQVIGKRLYQKVLKVSEETLGLPEFSLQQFKPWALATLLSMPVQQSGQFLDLTLYQEAVAQGIEVKGLETPQEQIQVFESLSDKEQVILLEDAIAQIDRLPAMLKELLDAYLAEDLDELQALSHAYQARSGGAAMRHFEVNLVEKRNHRMADRLLSILIEGGAVVAIGALHLPGVEGVLNLLREQGYRVTAVR